MRFPRRSGLRAIAWRTHLRRTTTHHELEISALVPPATHHHALRCRPVAARVAATLG